LSRRRWLKRDESLLKCGSRFRGTAVALAALTSFATDRLAKDVGAVRLSGAAQPPDAPDQEKIVFEWPASGARRAPHRGTSETSAARVSTAERARPDGPGGRFRFCRRCAVGKADISGNTEESTKADNHHRSVLPNSTFLALLRDLN
jgi:hypothetical protein